MTEAHTPGSTCGIWCSCGVAFVVEFVTQFLLHMKNMSELVACTIVTDQM